MPDFVPCSKESGMNLVWIHSVSDVGKLQKLLPFEYYEM